MDPTHSPEVRHEPTDAEARGVLGVLGALLLATALVGAGLVYLTRGLASFERAADPPPPPLAQEPGRLPPAPRLQTQPFADIERQRAEERRLLDSYGWVDEKAGIARIPIERAKKLLLERGLPAASAGSPEPPARGARP
jgi:hypothetical protein